MPATGASRRRRHSWFERSLLAGFIVFGIPSALFLSVFVVVFFALGSPLMALFFLAVTVAAAHAPFAMWLGPRYGRKVVWGCTGATMSTLFLVLWLVMTK